MGGTCSPETNEVPNDNEEIPVENLERADSTAGENFTKLINDYQTDNEKLKRQLEELKSRNQEGTTDQEEKARQNEQVMKELADMKRMLEQKDRALVRGQLEAALRSKATTMRSIESKTRLCMEGKLKHHHGSGFTKSRKVKHVEVLLTEGEIQTEEYKAGYVMLTYAESKGAQTAKRCQVLDVTVEDRKENEVILELNVCAEGALKALVFSCETGDQKDEWVKCISAALSEVRTTYAEMNEEFTIKLEFAKEKIGMRVEEKLVDKDEIEYDEKAKEAADNVDGSMRKAAREVEIEQKKASDCPEDEVKQLEQANVEAILKDEQEEEKKKQENPCELMVTKILDEDLAKAGLFEDCVLREINDTALVGMVFSDQIELLQNTPKPFTITFTGKNFVKKKGAPTNAYFSILKELVSDEENAVKKAFHELVKGTPFEKELQDSVNQVATIEALLADQRRLMALLQNLPVQEMEL